MTGFFEGGLSEEIPLHKLFERQARRTPDAPAVEDPGGSLTYRELNRQADSLAGYLRGEGVGGDDLVGVYMDRRVEYVVACLAALKAGGAYLPLEMAYPEALLGDVVADAGPRVVLTMGRHAGNLPEGTPHFCMDEGWEDGLLERATFRGESHRTCLDDLAFVSYSSGTTGKPKGIANPHRAAVGSYLWRFGVSDYGAGDRVGCNVFFIWEMLRPLLRGATTVVIPDDVIYDPGALIGYLQERRITEVLVTPSLLGAVLDAGGEDLADRLRALRTLWLNGEVVTKTLARRALGALSHTRILNVYSVSETHEVAAGDVRDLADNTDSTYCPVAYPVDGGEHLYVVDDSGSRLPDGEAGELYVGGDLLARGYVNLPEKTAERFVEDPFSAREGARMYRSGDRARVLPDGSLEILGRVDFMAKIRGYSVELGAVEAAIEEQIAVKTCVVIAEGEEGADKRLVAYLVPEDDEGDDRYAGWSVDKNGRSPEIRRRLAQKLPHYMIPAVYVEAASLPLQETTGKVDRSRLPAPPARAAAVAPGSTEPTLPADAPRAEKEARLARAFEEVLLLDEGDVAPDDDFFDLGGHSLAAAQLSGRIEEAFGVRLQMRILLDNPTVTMLCDAIEAHGRNGTADPETAAGRGEPPDLRAEAVLEPDIAPERGDEVAALRDA